MDFFEKLSAKIQDVLDDFEDGLNPNTQVWFVYHKGEFGVVYALPE